MAETIDAHPFSSISGRKKAIQNTYSVHSPAIVHTPSPKSAIHRNGEAENDVMASNASFALFHTGYFVSPAKRAARSYSTAVCLYPTQHVSPRMKRCSSRIFLSASTTRRLTNRKSPASIGMSTFASRWNTR